MLKKRSGRTFKAKRGAGNEDLLLDLIRKKRGDLLLALDCVQDPHNLGACLRTADAAGVGAVFAPRDRAVSVTETVRHVARGAAENVPFIQVTNLVRTLNKLKDHGFFVTGTSDRAEQSIYEGSFTGPTVLVMGSEGSGMRRLTTETCDQILKIPMRGYVDCLNISVAAGVCLFEIQRQRSLSAKGRTIGTP
jgi:23S rRNA (guanosine2251-2'-O)-methyltransferase